MYKIWRHFEKGQPYVCNYCMHETARTCPAYGLQISCFYCPNLITVVPVIRDKELCQSHMNMRYWRQYFLRWSGIYPSNFDVHYMAQFIYFTIEFWNSIFILFVCLLFAYLLSYWNSFAIAILGIKLRGIYMFHTCSCLAIYLLYNWVLKLNLHFVCLFAFCLFTKLLEFICNSDFRNQN